MIDLPLNLSCYCETARWGQMWTRLWGRPSSQLPSFCGTFPGHILQSCPLGPRWPVHTRLGGASPTVCSRSVTDVRVSREPDCNFESSCNNLICPRVWIISRCQKIKLQFSLKILIDFICNCRFRRLHSVNSGWVGELGFLDSKRLEAAEIKNKRRLVISDLLSL